LAETVAARDIPFPPQVGEPGARVEGKDQGLSIIVMRGGVAEPRTFTLSRRRLVAIKTTGLVLVLLFVAMAASWLAVASRAATATAMQQAYDSLLARHQRMDSLARRLAGLEARQDGFRRMIGVASSRDSALWLGNLGTGTGDAGGLGEGAATEPTAWPLTTQGFVTQSDGGVGDHPGIDIAVASGSYVRAAGGGVVVDAANDPVYGLFVLIDHGNGWRTRYGHASHLVAERGWNVRQGEVIALSGSTGRSTAPHLHFEILRNGRAIDPLSMVAPP
jgi:murein DD-endopeptidase MepM/ murein hydrolase activator NlpD